MVDDGASNARQLVGRRDELAALTGALRAVASGRGGAIWIHGEPGIGKTRLLDELCAQSDEQGHLVLAGRGAEFERDIPFGVWIDALDDYAGSLGHDRLQRLSGDRAAELAWVLPGIAPDEDAPAPALADERYRAHRAVRALLDGLARNVVVVVALDDLHWADAASLELLEHLLRRPPRGQVLIAVTFRSGGVPGSLIAALEAAARDGGATELTPTALTESEAGALFGGEVEPELLRQSGGNPFYLVELTRAAARDRSVAGRPLAEVPAAVAAALGQEIAALEPVSRALAEGAAVAGEPVDLDVAIAAAGLEHDSALDSLDALLDAGVLAPTQAPRRYRFRHPIVRRAVYEAAGERRRLQAHRRAATALKAQGGSLASRAHHLERCARPGEDDSVEVLVAAAHEARVRAPASAARWLAAALALVPADAEHAPERLQLLAPLAVAQAASGELPVALVTLEQALAGIPPQLTAMRAQLIAACAASENLLGRHQAAHARLLRALDELGELDPAAATVLLAELAADALYESDFAGMRDWASRAHESARQTGDLAGAACAAALGSFAEYSLGSTERAEAARAEAATTVDALTDDQLAACLAAPYYLGFAEFFCERYDDAVRHLRRGIAVARTTGQGQFLVPMMIGLAHGLDTCGEVREGADVADAAVDVARLAGNVQIVSWALTTQAWTAAMAGEHDRARSAGEEAVRLLDGLDESVLTLATRAHIAAMYLEVGDAQRCLAEMVPAGAPDFAHVEPGRRAWLGAYLALAELRCGRAAAAERAIGAAELTLEGLDLPMAAASVLHARAELELSEGDAPAAAQRAHEASDRAEAVGAVIQAARSQTLAGRALAAGGDRDGARVVLAGAESVLAERGAMRLRDEAARELRRLGRRAPGRARQARGAQGIDGLTGREREISGLVAEGCTNREIAERLFLSEKTVETHLSNAFSKLGVRSRAELAARLVRGDAGQPAG